MNNGLYSPSDIIFEDGKFRTVDDLYYAQSDALGLWTWQKRSKSSLKIPAYNHYVDDAFFTHQEAVEKLNEYLKSQMV
jgi:hypothetical protein